MEVPTFENCGADYFNSKYEEVNVKQSKNSYVEYLPKKIQQINPSDITDNFGEIFQNFTLETTRKMIISALPVSSIAFYTSAAAIKNTHYSSDLGTFDQAPQSRLPIIVFTNIADQTGDIARIGTIAGAIMLPFIINPLLVCSLITPVAYKMMDSYNWVPKNIGLSMEEYMPIVLSGVGFLKGSLFGKLSSATSLVTNIPTANKFLHQKIDRITSQYLQLEGPTLEEIDQPVLLNRNMTFNQINKILEADDQAFNIAAAHCATTVNACFQLEEDLDFKKFIGLCNQIDWKNNFISLNSKFIDDENFLNFLSAKFENKKITKGNFTYHLEILAKSEGLTPPQFLSLQVKKQMRNFVSILNGKKHANGSKKNLEEAISYCGQILTYVGNLDSNKRHQQIELEDILMKLAIEGGKYCVRGIKRASREVLDGIFQQDLQKKGDDSNPTHAYEIKLLAVFQQMRLKILENFYLKFIEQVVNVVNDGDKAKRIFIDTETTDEEVTAIAQDIHTLDLYRRPIVLGFYPLTNFERNSFTLPELLMWGSPFYPFRDMRNHMYQIYKQNLDEGVQEMGEFHFFNYFKHIIHENSSLSDIEKLLILSKYIDRNGDRWTMQETTHNFHRLIFVMLGILAIQKNYEGIDEWEIIEDSTVPDEDMSNWELN